MGIPAVIGIFFALAPWPVLRTALRDWDIAGVVSLGYFCLDNSRLVSDKQWDLCSDDTLALIMCEALVEAGWRLAPRRSVLVAHSCRGNGPKLLLLRIFITWAALLPVLARTGNVAPKGHRRAQVGGAVPG